GRAVALELLDRGYAVALVGRRLERLEETAETSGAGERALPLPADVADPDRVGEVFARVGREWGRLDVLFNNAGAMPPPAPVDEAGDDAWRHAVEVNLTGAFWCAREAIRMMRAQDPRRGRLINTGPTAAPGPRPSSAG